MWSPQHGWFIGENPTKMDDDLGVLHARKPSASTLFHPTKFESTESLGDWPPGLTSSHFMKLGSLENFPGSSIFAIFVKAVKGYVWMICG